MAVTTQIADGYPAPPGNKYESVLCLEGPKSYTQIGVASPPTGGQLITAAQFGMKYFDYISGGMSDDGQYLAFVTLMTTDKRGVTSARVFWMIAHTGLEVTGTTDLSARVVRLRAQGG